MFRFFKKLLKPKSQEKTIKVPTDAKLITTELVAASFVSLLISMLSDNSFNKNYKCVVNFIDAGGSAVIDPLTLDELLGVSEKELYEAKIISFAKKYTLLQCKSNDKVFDDWMHKVSCMIYKP